MHLKPQFARLLAAEGLHLVLVARRQPELATLTGELQQAHGVQCRVLNADLSGLEAVHQLADATADLDVGLVVAAAGFGTSGPLLNAELGVEWAAHGVDVIALPARRRDPCA